jgi:3-hydroxyisobutyrate dehydrogenase-like beta-hydroxyacid dehydrogenase
MSKIQQQTQPAWFEAASPAKRGAQMTNGDDTKTVAVLGLGNMGGALAEALLSAGFPVIVWNRTPTKSVPLVERGAKAAKSTAEAARASDLAIICVTDHTATLSVIQNDTFAEALEGKALAQLGVITAEESCQIANWAKAQNIDYLESSIMGLPDEVRNSMATLVCSGPKRIFDDNKDVLTVFGNAVHVSEAVGAAYEFDKTYYPFGYAMMQGFIQGAALAHASGFSIEAYTRVMTTRLSVFPERLERLGTVIADRNHDGDQAGLYVWADTFAKSLSLCRTLGVDDTLPTALMRNFEKAIESGYREKEISALFEVLLPKRGE